MHVPIYKVLASLCSEIKHLKVQLMLMGSANSSVNFNKNVRVIMFGVLVYCKYFLNSTLHEMFSLDSLLLCARHAALSSLHLFFCSFCLRLSLWRFFFLLFYLCFSQPNCNPAFGLNLLCSGETKACICLRVHTYVQFSKSPVWFPTLLWRPHTEWAAQQLKEWH